MKHFFLRDANNFPLACIATEKTDHVLTYGLSICNPLDFKVYDHDRMRNTARARLGYLLGFKIQNKDGKEVVVKVAPRYQHTTHGKGKLFFTRAKVGSTTFADGESPKMVLLETLHNDPVFQSHEQYAPFVAALGHEIVQLKKRMDERANNERQSAGLPAPE